MSDYLQLENASKIYLKLAAYDIQEADHVLQSGATLYQYLNKEMKYSAYIEPYALRQF